VVKDRMKFIRLDSNENPCGCSPLAKKAVIEYMEDDKLSKSQYPDEYTMFLRSAISEKYGVDRDEVFCGNGADEIIYLLGNTFINPGDEVILPEISFASYASSASFRKGKIVCAPLKDDFGIDLDAVLKAITENTKYIVLVNPNNPTGTMFCEEEQYEFLKKVPEDILVIIDEAYAEFYMGANFPNTCSMLRDFDNLIILKTFSKIYGLASFRIGFIMANKKIISSLLSEDYRAESIQRFNVTTLAMIAAQAALKDDVFLENTKTANDRCLKNLCKHLDNMGYSYVPSHANFLLINIRRDCTPVVESLEKKGYLVRPGTVLNADRLSEYIRVSIGTNEQMEGFIHAFKDCLKL